MIQLKENQGIPRSILLMMAIIAGLTVANCYYNQPLLELIRHDLGITEQSANLITVITQIGYALGLFFLIPMGDMFSRPTPGQHPLSCSRSPTPAARSNR